MVGQILITAVQNDVDRRVLGVATAATSFFRGLGGAVGAALLGAVFAARVGAGTAAEVADAVRIVFLAGAGIAVVALGVVLALREVPLRGPGDPRPARPDRRGVSHEQDEPVHVVLRSCQLAADRAANWPTGDARAWIRAAEPWSVSPSPA